jgi:hypothetical protein
MFQIYHEDESCTDVPTKIVSKQQEYTPKPKPCTITSPEGNESKITSCSEGPVAVQLQGNKDQSKKMAAMTTIENLSTKDTSVSEEKQGLPITEKDKSKEINYARVLKAQIGLKEQQLEYKQLKDREFQTQLHRRARQLALHSRPIQDPDSFHSTNPEFAGIWNYERYDTSAKSRGRGIFFEPCSPTEEDINDVQPDDSSHYSGVFESRGSSHSFLVDQIEKSSTKTVRVGPGYSVLALPDPPQSSAVTTDSLSTWDDWVEVSRGMIMCVTLAAQ